MPLLGEQLLKLGYAREIGLKIFRKCTDWLNRLFR